MKALSPRAGFRRLLRARTYPNRFGRPVRKDPTYGRIDRDVQWHVQDIGPSSLGQRVAMENTIQRSKDRSR